MSRPIIIAGNWKMNKTVSEGLQFLAELTLPPGNKPNLEVMIFPPATSLYSLGRQRPELTFGAQNIHEQPSGAFTGEISATMTRECATVALIGHSERRHLFQESDRRIREKVLAALQSDLRPMLCLGETLEERQQGRTDSVVLRQLEQDLSEIGASKLGRLMIAYEPVWAIGTGLTATPQQAQEVHALIRRQLTTMGLGEAPILYGGSVKPDNARELLCQADIDGLLIGGASLQAQNFSDIIALAYELLV